MSIENGLDILRIVAQYPYESIGVVAATRLHKTYVSEPLNKIFDEIEKKFDKSLAEGKDVAGAVSDVLEQAWNRQDRERHAAMQNEDQSKEHLEKQEQQLKDNQVKEDFAKQEYEKQAHELKELYEKQEQQQKELVQKEEFQKADAAEKERQMKELFDKQELGKQELFRQQAARDQETFKIMQQPREEFQREQQQQREQLREEIEFQNEPEVPAPAREQEAPQHREAESRANNGDDARGPDGLNWSEVKRAEEARNKIEFDEMRRGQEKALAREMKGVEPLGPEAIEARREQLEKRFEQQTKDLVEQQRDRLDRQELLYKGPPSERAQERER